MVANWPQSGDEIGYYSDPALRAVPGMSVSVLSLLGLPLNEWVYLLTMVYLLLQIGIVLVDKIIKPWLRARRAHRTRQPEHDE